MNGVILYGPPAAGKDTVTDALTKLDRTYRLFPRLKAGGGRTAGYRAASSADLEALRRSGGVLWENTRYGAIYAVDRTYLEQCLESHVPVLHLGQPEAIPAVTLGVQAARWTVVELWCPWDVAIQRIAARGTGDETARQQAWLQTPRLSTPDMQVDTSRVSAGRAARMIHAEAKSRRTG